MPSAKMKIETYKRRIAKLRQVARAKNEQANKLTAKMQAECSHPLVLDKRETDGYWTDNGYGRWWRNPCFECVDCGLVSRSDNFTFDSPFKRENVKP